MKIKKAVAWAVFLLFVAGSAVANYLHGSDPVSSCLLAALPIAYTCTIGLLEILQTAGSKSRTAYVALGLVATAAGVASYLGLFGLAREHGIDVVPAALAPLGFDGVILASSLAIRALGGHKGDGEEAIPTTLPAVPVHVPTSPPASLAIPARPPVIPDAPPAFLPVIPLSPAARDASPERPSDVPSVPPASLDVPPASLRLIPAGDAASLLERYGDVLPAQRVAKQELGWGSKRVAEAYASLKSAS